MHPDLRPALQRLADTLHDADPVAVRRELTRFGAAFMHAAELHRARRAQVAKTYRAQAVSLTAPMIRFTDAKHGENR